MDESEFWKQYRESKIQKRNRLEPDRMQFAALKLLKYGFKTEWDDYERCLIFKYKIKNKQFSGKFYPYTAWYSGKGIGSDRGLTKLINKLKDLK